MAITLSHGGPTIFQSPERSRQVLVGTVQGVVCLERDAVGPGWHVASRSLADKHIHALLIEPGSGTIFAGVNHGSIFASVDGGGTWERRDHGLTEPDVYRPAAPARRGPPLAGRSIPVRQRRPRVTGPSFRPRWGYVPAVPAPPTSPMPAHRGPSSDAQTLFVGVEQRWYS
jgi:hypothetical protein